MKNNRRLNIAETRAEESMTPKAWLIMLADEMAQSKSVLVFAEQQFNAAHPAESSFFKPQKIYERMACRGCFKKYLNMSYEYRRIATTMLNISIENFENLIKENLVVENLRLRQVSILCIRQTRWFGSIETPNSILGEFIGQTHQRATNALLGVRTAISAIDAFSREHLAGREFLPLSGRKRLVKAECIYVKMIDDLTKLLPLNDHVYAKSVTPSEGTVQQMVDRWIFKGERTARRLIYNDDKGIWTQAKSLFFSLHPDE